MTPWYEHPRFKSSWAAWCDVPLVPVGRSYTVKSSNICLFQEARSRGIAKAASEPIAPLDEKNVQKIPQVSRHVAKPTNKHANCEETNEKFTVTSLSFRPMSEIWHYYAMPIHYWTYWIDVDFCLICSPKIGASSWALQETWHMIVRREAPSSTLPTWAPWIPIHPIFCRPAWLSQCSNFCLKKNVGSNDKGTIKLDEYRILSI